MSYFDSIVSPAPGAVRRRPIALQLDELVRQGESLTGSGLPLVLVPAVDGLHSTRWASAHRDWLHDQLLKAGAILFRGFGVTNATDFQDFIEACDGAPMEYRERSSPRREVTDPIYTSTDHPAHQSIFPHNEHSYSRRFPMHLYFWCDQPAEAGGATPLVDCRRVLQRIPGCIRDRFENKWMYVRNFGSGCGLDWPEAFQTHDRTEVERYCRDHDIEFEWIGGNRLRSRQVRPVTIRHPKSGDLLWFNHATFFHVSTLDESLQISLRASFAEADLPNNTYYADGSPIEPEVLDELRNAYTSEIVSFPWQRGDVLLVDNLLVAHGRNPFRGARRVLVGMAEPFERTDF